MAEKKKITQMDPSPAPDVAVYHIRQVSEKGIDQDERDRRYDRFAELYDTALADCDYTAPTVTADTTAEYIPVDKRGKVLVLDIGAGTGLVGEELRKRGFQNIDGLEPSKGMISILQEKQAYRQCICDKISSEPLNIPKDSYDVLTVCGSHGENHIECAALHEMIRLVKSGGLIVIVTRMENLKDGDQYKNCFFPLCDELERYDKWRKKEINRFPNYLSGIEGVKLVFEVC